MSGVDDIPAVPLNGVDGKQHWYLFQPSLKAHYVYVDDKWAFTDGDTKLARGQTFTEKSITHNVDDYLPVEEWRSPKRVKVNPTTEEDDFDWPQEYSVVQSTEPIVTTQPPAEDQLTQQEKTDLIEEIMKAQEEGAKIEAAHVAINTIKTSFDTESEKLRKWVGSGLGGKSMQEVRDLVMIIYQQIDEDSHLQTMLRSGLISIIPEKQNRPSRTNKQASYNENHHFKRPNVHKSLNLRTTGNEDDEEQDGMRIGSKRDHIVTDKEEKEDDNYRKAQSHMSNKNAYRGKAAINSKSSVDVKSDDEEDIVSSDEEDFVDDDGEEEEECESTPPESEDDDVSSFSGDESSHGSAAGDNVEDGGEEDQTEVVVDGALISGDVAEQDVEDEGYGEDEEDDDDEGEGE